MSAEYFDPSGTPFIQKPSPECLTSYHSRQPPWFAVGAVEQTGGFVVAYNLLGVGVPLEAVDSKLHGDVA